MSATGKSAAAGFTLIELLVVLSILVGLTVAFPLSWERLSPQHQVRVYARQLVSDLRSLRSEAMATNRETTWALTESDHAYRLGATGKTRVLPEALQATMAATGPQPAASVVHFFPDGSSSGGEIRLARDHRVEIVSVSALTGKVTQE
jgi:general secretion pathway protein H